MFKILIFISGDPHCLCWLLGWPGQSETNQHAHRAAAVRPQRRANRVDYQHKTWPDQNKTLVYFRKAQWPQGQQLVTLCLESRRIQDAALANILLNAQQPKCPFFVRITVTLFTFHKKTTYLVWGEQIQFCNRQVTVELGCLINIFEIQWCDYSELKYNKRL